MSGTGSALLERIRALFHRRSLADAVALLIAGALLAVVVASVRPAGGRGLDHLTRSYITPFPEENRYRLYVLGDSLGDGLWSGLNRAFEHEPDVEVIKRSRGSTGFARPGSFDWNATLGSMLRAEKVHIAVVMMGVSDMRPIRVKKKSYKVGTDAWREAYSRRVDRFIKQLKEANVAVYWVGLPIMRSPGHNEDMQAMNEIFRERAFINNVKFVDTWNGFTDQFGRYSAFGPDLSGQVRRLRAGDGVHFTIQGYRKLAHFVEREVRRDLRQARSEQEIPLAGNEAEQRRAVGRAPQERERAASGRTKSGAQSSDSASDTDKAERRADARRAQAKTRALKSAALAAGEAEAALPENNAKVAGMALIRPEISRAALAAAGSGYVPQGEFITGELKGGVTALSSVSPVSDSDPASAQQHLPLSQRPYYRVLVKGEDLTPKPDRADDFSWPAGKGSTAAASSRP